MFKKYDPSKITEGMKQLLKATVNDDDFFAAYKARQQLAAALTGQLREGIFWGDIASDIFPRTSFEPGTAVEYPLDPIAPGTEKEYVAFTSTQVGDIPRRYPEGDYLMVPYYPVANSIDWEDRWAREARWDVVSRLVEVFEAGLVKKFNDDCWHLLLSAALDRNIMVFDSDANQGQFTKRLISLMKVIMRRNGGGNSTSINRFKLTDMYLSPEGIEDIRNWNLDQIDEFTRRDIFVAEDGSFNRIFSVNLHDIDELGEAQEYQNFYLSDLGGQLSPIQASHSAADVELVVGLDLISVPAFKCPEVLKMSMKADMSLERQGKQGYYGREIRGLAILDNRPVLLGSY